MRRMVGAAMVVVGLGTASVLGFLRQRAHTDANLPQAAIIESPIGAETLAFRPDSLGTSNPQPITYLSDPLAFLSTATADSLDLLPGVGPVLAARLIAARETNGAFRSWDQVDRVRGIGPKTIERLQALATR
jgi:competence ComEA-like helix-hairpin-helix protein